MMILCYIAVITASHTIINFDVHGSIISENKSQYLVDFSKDLAEYNFSLVGSLDGKELVDKENCIK